MKSNIVITILSILLTVAITSIIIVDYSSLSETTLSILGFALMSSSSLSIISITNEEKHGKG